MTVADMAADTDLAADFATTGRRLGLAEVGTTGVTVAIDLQQAAPVTVLVDDVDGDPVTSAESASAIHHEIRVDGLVADTRYRYRLEVDGAVIDRLSGDDAPFEFRTAPGADLGSRGNFCFGLFADPQDQDFSEVLPTFATAGASFDVALGLGDFVVISTDEHYLDYLLGPLSPVFARLPFFGVVGNHDLGNTSNVATVAAHLATYRRNMVMPMGDLAGWEETVYAFRWGSVEVAVLNSGDRNTGGGVEVITADQLTWLTDRLTTSDARWKIVALHHLVHGWEVPEGVPQAEWFHVGNYEAVHDAFVAAGVDLVLSGHRHAYNAYVLDGITYVVVPTFARNAVLYDRYGALDYPNEGGELGTFEHAFTGVFGYSMLCGDDTSLEIETTAFAGDQPGLVPVTTPNVIVPPLP